MGGTIGILRGVIEGLDVDIIVQITSVSNPLEKARQKPGLLSIVYALLPWSMEDVHSGSFQEMEWRAGHVADEQVLGLKKEQPLPSIQQMK